MALKTDQGRDYEEWQKIWEREYVHFSMDMRDPKE